jgi:hypothetical protein
MTDLAVLRLELRQHRVEQHKRALGLQGGWGRQRRVPHSPSRAVAAAVPDFEDGTAMERGSYRNK